MRRVVRLALFVSCALAGLTAEPAHAEKRVALVIGNADYKVGPLQNPLRDAAAVAAVFEKRLKFDKVILRTNLTFDGFRAALREMARESAGADLAVVYFAGHGAEVGGKNFLIPIDASLAQARDLNLEAVQLDTVLDQIAGATKLKLVMLDACRNNPFALAGGKRSVTRGLARIEPEDNTLVVYAARDGTTADDGVGRKHSPFTEALLKHIAAPGVEVRLLFGRVRDDVAEATRHQPQPQQPNIYGTLGGREFYFVPPAPAPAAAEDGKREQLDGLKAEVERLKAAMAGKEAAPAGSSPAAEVTELKATITRLQAEIRRLETARPPAAPTSPSRSEKAASEARPNPTAYSLNIWKPGALKLGETVTANTPYGPLTCTSRGPPSGGQASRPCRWGK